MADSPGSSPSIRSQTEEVLPEKKNNENGDRKSHERERSLNAVSAAARTKLTQLIQLASEAEEQTDYKKVVDTVFDSVGKYIFYLYICKRCNLQLLDAVLQIWRLNLGDLNKLYAIVSLILDTEEYIYFFSYLFPHKSARGMLITCHFVLYF